MLLNTEIKYLACDFSSKAVSVLTKCTLPTANNKEPSSDVFPTAIEHVNSELNYSTFLLPTPNRCWNRNWQTCANSELNYSTVLLPASNRYWNGNWQTHGLRYTLNQSCRMLGWKSANLHFALRINSELLDAGVEINKPVLCSMCQLRANGCWNGNWSTLTLIYALTHSHWMLELKSLTQN
eukprot:9023053-Ditylum_brightwellii.AAC.1